MDKKSVLRAMIVGGALIEILVSWLAPKSIVWYFDPPVQMGFTCREPIEWALQRLQTVQLVGLGVGAVLGVIVLMVYRKRQQAKNFPGTFQR